ncbi:hypothetical protein [Bradyrhizobium erythrophlei]|jgi:hypothetical protein|uniref:Uncharacterized protein n=1 Tax=Bradyrhizobium erythrophlei TaxID=1437360 RepID=A0A1M7UDE5_9BRAD|nr:hypothetical protein [Bradyrhizobium erythrophlei]SHN80964.1 hypothetical protein SAMN05444170_4562 [Bradyrhizobium erythrophlei]
MIKSLSALAIFALLGVSVIALPGFAPEVKAREVAVLGKSDRLEVRTTDCSTQVWPNFAASCLRRPGSSSKILEARLVTTPR